MRRLDPSLRLGVLLLAVGVLWLTAILRGWV